MKKGLSLKKTFFLCIIFFAKNNLLLCSHSSSEETESKFSDSSEASLSSTISLDQSPYVQNDSPEEKISDNETKQNKESNEALRQASYHIPIKPTTKKLRLGSNLKASSQNIGPKTPPSLDQLLYTFKKSKAKPSIKIPQSFKQAQSIYDYLSEEDFTISKSINLPTPSNPIAIPEIKIYSIDPLTDSSEETSSPTPRILYPPFAPEKKSPAEFIENLHNKDSEDRSEDSTEKSSSPDTNQSITRLFAKEGAKFLIIPILQIYYFMDELKKLGELEYQSKHVNTVKTQEYKEQKNTLMASLQSTVIDKLYFQEHILGNNNQYYSVNPLNGHSITPDRLYEDNKEIFLTCNEKSLIKSFANNGLSLDHQINLFEKCCDSKNLNPVVTHALMTYGKVFEILEQFNNKKDGKKPICFNNRVAIIQKIKADIEIFDPKIVPNQEDHILKILTRQKLFNLIDSYNSKMSDLYLASSDKTLANRYKEMIFVPSSKIVNTATHRYLAQNIQ